MPQKRKNKRSIVTKLADFCEFPLDCSQKIPIVELKGNREVYVSGCLKIVEYSQDIIIFDAGEYTLEISGEGMLMREFAADSVCIRGEIFGIKVC